MSLPSFAPFPPSPVRLSLASEEWEACLDAWLTLSELTVRSPSSRFEQAVSGSGSVQKFLASFYHELATSNSQDLTLSSPKAMLLRKSCFKLVGRTFTQLDPIPAQYLDLGFLSDVCRASLHRLALGQLMSLVWRRKSNRMIPALQKHKAEIATALESGISTDGFHSLSQLAPIFYVSADIGAFFMTGSDLLDAVAVAYTRTDDGEQRKTACVAVYLGLLALVKIETPNVSLVSDHLYALEGQAKKRQSGPSLLADLVTNTDFLDKIRLFLGPKTPERIYTTLDHLAAYSSPSLTRPRKKPARRRNLETRADASALHVHRLSFVTQIQDLFPDLGSGFILRLLDAYSDDVEQVTAHLLDESLPAHLASLDRTEVSPISDEGAQASLARLAPRATPPQSPYVPERRNIFDGDELDDLEIGTARLHIGKKDRKSSVDGQPNKAAILSALAAFDSNDDERDDTYDVEDVGGTVDTSHPDGEPGVAAKVTQEENDAALFTVYKSSPALFGRTFDIRRGQARMALKAETGMTDEAIEGWAIMLQRDSRRLKRLEAQLGSFDGRQTELASTAYRDSAGGTETEDSDAPGGGHRGGGYRGRGRGRAGRGRGAGKSADVAGPSNDPGTANAQRRKEANKGSRANHNRRDQRARKMARGGFAG